MELTELIESIDILEYISQYTDFTEKNGEYWALSPLKEENTPSFSVRKEDNTFFDFSSGIGGNVLTFVRYFDKCGYKEAIEKLKKYSGFDGTVPSHRKLAATEVAKRFSPPKKAQKQSKATILPDDYMERYEKRDDKLAVWGQEGISRASMDKFQVYYDSFSDRLVYPIRNPDGKIVNIGGRTLDPAWKEKQLRKYTYFFPWGELKTLYGLAENIDSIKKQREIILFEGCKSVLLADTYGVHNTGAILTSHLNPNQMKLLVGLGCRVVFALDKDVSMQETIMQFLVHFCGYSAAESDNVRRAIAKKKGTETLLPEIESRFTEYCSSHYDMTTERCEEIIKPFLQIILDASAYGFSWNHSDAYSAIGYICGYLRYYYPLEFLTAALNIFGDNMEKTADITNYATKVGIKVTLPKWGLSRGEYFFDREKRIIAKGLSSIKYMSAGLADELYGLAQNKYTSFMDLLKDLNTNSTINSRQLDILIKLDFFSDFGNQRELLRMVSLFTDTFKKGEAKQVKKSVIDGTPLEPIVQKYAVGVTKSGGEAKNYTLLDVMSILRGAEEAIRAVGMEDLSDIIKVRNFYDVMGYIGYVSGAEADRRKLYVTDVKPLYRKKDNKLFGYSVFTKSIGSGKESRFTVFCRVYDKDPIKSGDIIYCTGFERDGQYFRLTSYNKVYSNPVLGTVYIKHRRGCGILPNR